MKSLPDSVRRHRIKAADLAAACEGEVRYAPLKSAWFLLMLLGAMVGAVGYFSLSGLAIFVITTCLVLLFGHSLGSHRKLIHDSYQCPKWLGRSGSTHGGS